MASEQTLEGMRVVLFEARRAPEAAELVRRFGGEPVTAPAMREVPVGETEAVRAFVRALERGEVDVAVFLTGVGTRLLADAASPSCPPERLAALLSQPVVVARGPKPTAALRQLGRPPDLTVPEPNTWRELLALLDRQVPLRGKRVAVQEYGEPNPELLAGLRERGAAVLRVPIYRWALPEDLAPLRAGIDLLSRGEAAAAVFTSATQVRHVFEVAGQMGRRQALRDVLRERAVVASIGPVCSEALRGAGVPPDIEPAHPRLGQLVAALARNAAAVLARKAPPGSPAAR